MPILAGQKLTASMLRLLRPAEYTASATGDLNGAVTQADVPGCSVTLTTLTDGATWSADGYFDADQQGTSTSLMLGYCDVDGVIQSQQAVNSDPVASDRHTVSQMWSGTFATAGTHTVKLRGTLAASQSFRVGNTRLRLIVREAV